MRLFGQVSRAVEAANNSSDYDFFVRKVPIAFYYLDLHFERPSLVSERNFYPPNHNEIK